MIKTQKDLFEENKEYILEYMYRADEQFKNRKEHAENKIVGYTAIVSLLITISIATLSILRKEYITQLYVLLCVSTIYWSLLTFIVSLIGLKPRNLALLPVNRILEESVSTEQEQLKNDIIGCYKRINCNNEKTMYKVALYNDLMHIFLTVTFISTIIQLIYFVILVIRWLRNG